MSRVLRYTLVVRHPETGASSALLAGQPVPEWASDLVHKDDLADDSAGGYDAMKVDELKAELVKRGLSDEGKKADLVAALEADDA